MARFMRAIHVLLFCFHRQEVVDGPDKPGHDGSHRMFQPGKSR
jgi:hypothetical protein